MEQLTEFILNHWVLSLAFVAIAGLLVAGEIQQRIGGLAELGPMDATQMVNHKDAVLMDVRETSDQKDGVIPNAVLIPISRIKEKPDALDKYRDRPVIAYCNTGQLGRRACSILRKQGLESVYNLAGGLTAWKNANMPTHKNS